MAEPVTEAAADAPLYLRVAAALREDLANRHIAPGNRLPSERSLSQRYHVNRQTVRSALQLLRDERLVVTDRRGTFASSGPGGPGGEGAAPTPTARRPIFPGGPRAADSLVRASLTWEPPPAPLAPRLLLTPGEPTLVHRHMVLGPQGSTLQRAVSWFSRPALSEIPQLSRYRRGRDCRQQPDLRLLYHWMHQAGLRITHRESVGVPPGPATAGGATRLVVHRVVTDQHGHALEITDIDCSARSASWTYEFSV
ncbi:MULTISPECIES: winged helix-turn-helix domain-containing protein [unclassified Streptomyces]|uniref:winged helix-turn-helix domain-containing protein n=1 Tax=unclassified Streptomyces TaxID=2593676 RepID=UPI00166178E2|nr:MULTISPECIES: winged helix-turn-helix domain-containing protein [unclassified Streptomyces]MBD0708798.1 GntR family transcriptional regulator [Streptomyces sp. CBMA291]MBD0714736.1 GntR family transcriptional regulator [Streptomyces sp. CBMA370]